MRVVLVGASATAVGIAQILAKRKHDVIIIERDKERIDALAAEIDCGFVHGDGSTPEILREVSPEATDYLICLTSSDQDNIIASLVGRSLGFERIVTKIADPEFEPICTELGLETTIVPHETIARTVADMVEGRSALELSTFVRGELRFFSFVARAEDEGPVRDIELPAAAKIAYLYRGEEFELAEPETNVAKGDEVVIVTHSRNLEKLAQRWEYGKRGTRKARR